MDVIHYGHEYANDSEPRYYKGERGNKPYPIGLMLRLHILQNLYNLSDTTPATNQHDVTMTAQLLCGEETEVYGDSGFLGAEKRADAVLRNRRGRKVRYHINRRPSQCKGKNKRSQGQIKRYEHEKSSVREKVEYIFGVAKQLFKFRKTRLRGLAKQRAQQCMVFALAYLYLAPGSGTGSCAESAQKRENEAQKEGQSANVWQPESNATSLGGHCAVLP